MGAGTDFRSRAFENGNPVPVLRPPICDDRPVLVAVDISWSSRRALLWTCKYVSLTDAPLKILHVLYDPAEAARKFQRNFSCSLLTKIDTAEAMLQEFLAEVKDNYPDFGFISKSQILIEQGSPAQTIVTASKKYNARLTVIGSRGSAELSTQRLGSTAREVIRTSTTPIIVVQGPS